MFLSVLIFFTLAVMVIQFTQTVAITSTIEKDRVVAKEKLGDCLPLYTKGDIVPKDGLVCCSGYCDCSKFPVPSCTCGNTGGEKNHENITTSN